MDNIMELLTANLTQAPKTFFSHELIISNSTIETFKTNQERCQEANATMQKMANHQVMSAALLHEENTACKYIHFSYTHV